MTARSTPTKGAWVPPHRRSVGLLAQEPRLFPHLSVLENVAFGLRSSGMPRRPGSRPPPWSGWARWTSSSGRTTSPDSSRAARHSGWRLRGHWPRSPSSSCLDEPLSSLDVQATPDLRQLLRRVLAERTTVLVTHDILDAILLADEVAMVEHGVSSNAGRRPRC